MNPWEKYAQPQTPGPWAKYQAQPAQTQSSGQSVIATTGDGGRVVRAADGSMSFTSPSYATSDPAIIAKIMEGAKPADVVKQDFYEDAITQHPIAARGAAAISGVPFVGSWMDEAVGLASPTAADAMRFSQKAMSETRPGQDMSLKLGAGLLAAVPAAIAAAPSVIGGATSLAGQVIRGAIGGAAVGATEGAVYGAGDQSGAGRGANAGTGAAIGGGLGGIIGGAAPALATGAANLLQRVRNTPEKTAAAAIGVTPEATRLLGRVFASDAPDVAAAQLGRSGPSGMLADVGPTAQSVLDTAMQAPGPAARLGKTRIEERAANALKSVNQGLDDVLGQPQGIKDLQAEIRNSTQEARSSAYDAAYSQPIDYASEAGRGLENLQSRLPGKAISYANELMRLRGENSKQILADIGNDGSVKFTRLPDVRQWDYIKQALDQMAESGDGAGAMGGQTRLGSAYQGLARTIRDALATSVPEYRTALQTAADPITRIKGVELGTKILSPTMTREAVSNAVKGATAPEKEAIKAGVRQRIDDTLANVAAVASDPNIDAREARKALALLTSRAARDKLRLLVGSDAAKSLMARIDEASAALGLRANVATNSRTAGREMTKQFIGDTVQPSPMTQLAQGRPINAVQAIMENLTGSTKRDLGKREANILAEVTDVLTRSGNRDAVNALRIIQTANESQPISEQSAREIAKAFVAATGSTGYLQARQGLEAK